ncbi:hypothetical protein [Selenomonas sp. AE3005]|uniref:hypothetical protein n=1 Tax=Selenomonas sp. AE3005 TaxID=1485543 RepID=UPI000484A6D9|nr:hypothetical protein [Selenomonas sp. AE3005]
MGRGGARVGAGRKKAEVEKKIRGFRLTDNEWAFIKKVLDKYRNSNVTEPPAKQPSNDSLQVRQSNSTNEEQGASLLAHLEYLYRQQYRWLLEYRDYMKDENYDKYTLDEISLHQEMVHLQKLTLLPHLQKLKFSERVKSACSLFDVASIHPVALSCIKQKNELYVYPWKEQETLDYNEVNKSLDKTFEALSLLELEVKALEKKFEISKHNILESSCIK